MLVDTRVWDFVNLDEMMKSEAKVIFNLNLDPYFEIRDLLKANLTNQIGNYNLP